MSKNKMNVLTFLDFLVPGQLEMKENQVSLIFKYLSLEDKFNCTLVCKSWNKYLSSMDCFCLNLNIDNRKNDKRTIPVLKREYTSVIIEHYEFYILDSLMMQMLKHLGRTVVRVKLSCILTDLMILSQLLCELPLLKSLELIQIEFNDEELSSNFPKFLFLNKLKIEMGWSADMKEPYLSLFKRAPKIQSFSLIKAKLEVNELKMFLKQHQNSLESLSIKSCEMYIDSTDSECDFNILKCLNQLRKLYLINNNGLSLKNVSSDSILELEDFAIKYKSNQNKQVNLLLNCLFQYGCRYEKLSEYEANKCKEPLMIYRRNFMKNVHIHYCSSNRRKCDHKNCKLSSLTNLNENDDFFSFLSILVRDNAEDFNNINYKNYYESDINNEQSTDDKSTTFQEKKELILKLVWKYLKHKDKLSCTRVCKSFNSFISSMDSFNLKIDYRQFHPTSLTRYYKTVNICHYKFDHKNYLLIFKMLKHLGSNVTKLKLTFCTINLKELCTVLDYFSMLESLKLMHVQLENVELPLDFLPKFLYLNKLKIKIKTCIEMRNERPNNNIERSINELLPIFGHAKNIHSFHLNNVSLEMNVLNNFIKNNKNLKYFSSELCNITKDPKYSECNLDFDSLLQLRGLRLDQSEELPLNVLTSNNIILLTDILITSRDKELFRSFLRDYFKQMGINDAQITKYEADKRKVPIITKTKCPITEKVITKFYHVHHCFLMWDCLHHHCNLNPLTETIRYGSGGLEEYCFKFKIMPTYSCISIQVRENVKDFNIIKPNGKLYFAKEFGV